MSWLSRRIPKLFAVVALLATATKPGVAKDLDLLIRYLVPVFLSQDLAEACRGKPGFLSDLPHGAASVDETSQKIKFEVTDGLDSSEAPWVDLAAANTALKAARTEMRKLADADGHIPAGTLDTWCFASAQPLILKIMRANEQSQSQMLAAIRRAKSD